MAPAMRHSLSFLLCLGLSTFALACDDNDEGTTTENAESMGMEGMEESDESSTLGTGDTNDSMATETGEDTTTGAPGGQTVCCSCVEGVPVGCEPWEDGGECEGVIVDNCVYVAPTFDCGDAVCE